MYVKKNLLLWAAVFALALPLFFVGTASAIYFDDGALPSNDVNNWAIRDKGVCILGIHADGSVDYGTETSRPACIAHLFTDASDNTSAGCTSFTNLESASHYWASTCITAGGAAVSLDGLDRTTANCILKGGAGATMKSSCVGAWAYEGTGTHGSNEGFCATTVDLTSYGTTSVACPNLVSNTPGYSVSGSGAAAMCVYAPATAGYLSAAVNKKDTTLNFAKGAYVDLTTYTSYGACLANGFKWWPISSNVNDATNTNASRLTKVTTIATAGTATGPSTLSPVLGGRQGGCLECHNSISQNNGYAERWKDSYLKTGHKNMLRKVTAGTSFSGPDANGVLGAYTAAASSQSLDFANGQATGSYGTKTLMYLFGDWMAAAPDGLDTVVWNNGAKYNGGSGYSCAACHSTGFANVGATGTIAGVCSQSSKATQSACTTAGGTWYPSFGTQATTTITYNPGLPGNDWLSSGTVTVNANGTINGITGKWDRNGIQCARCHNAGFNDQVATLPSQSTYNNNPTAPNLGGHNYTPANNKNEQVNGVCYSCHQSMPKNSINGGTGNGPDVDLAIGAVSPGVSVTATTADFSGHPIGQEFLNSPHARYTGSVVPNAVGKYDLLNNVAANYNSLFKGYVCRDSTTVASGNVLSAYYDTASSSIKEIKSQADCMTANTNSLGAATNPAYWQAESQGACTTCHDVHNSLFVAGQEEKAMKRECTTCHVEQAGTVYSTLTAITIAHPTGTGTPRENEVLSPASPCEICHMPKASAAGFPLHLWRINADANYSTFPTFADFTTLGTDTKKLANTYTDSKGYTNAIGVDLGISCGQCHGASGTAHLMSKTAIASFAQAMHGGGAAPSTTCTDCHTDKSLATLNHVAVAACTSCHSRPGVAPTVTTGTCDKCHSIAQNVTDRFAYGIHTVSVRPAFTWSNDATTAYKINLDASTSQNCSSYTWDFGGGTGGSNVAVTSTTYATSSAATVTLTCDGVSVAKTVSPKRLGLNQRPLLIPQGTVAATGGYSVLFTDATSTAPGTGNYTVKIMWGDGKSEIISKNSSTPHTYAVARKYALRMMAIDAGLAGVPGQVVSTTIPVTIAKLNITGTVTNAASSNLQGAVISLKVGTKLMKKAVSKADGTYTFLNVVPVASLPKKLTDQYGTTYTVEATKRLIVSGQTPTVYHFTPVTPTDAGATNVNFQSVE